MHRRGDNSRPAVPCRRAPKLQKTASARFTVNNLSLGSPSERVPPVNGVLQPTELASMDDDVGGQSPRSMGAFYCAARPRPSCARAVEVNLYEITVDLAPKSPTPQLLLQ